MFTDYFTPTRMLACYSAVSYFVPESDFYELHSYVLDLLDSNKNLLDSLFISNTKAEWNSSSSANVSHTKEL